VSPLDLTTPLGIAQALLPEILLSAWTLIVLLVVAWRHTTAEDSRLAGWLSLAGIITAGAALAWLWTGEARPAGLTAMIALDEYRFAAAAIILLAAAGTVVISLRYLEREQLLAPEYYPLVLLGTAGMLFLAGAEDMMVLFLGLEVMSVAVYVLAGYDRRDIYSSEAALKYFLIGAFASGFLLYGIALVYGATGQTGFALIGAQLGAGQVPMMATLGLGLLLIGFGFKVAAVPFHMWAPDVYDGAPTPVTGYMATGVKVAAFAALARMLVESFPQSIQLWQPVIGVLAVATMVAGNLIALAQRTIKRMLAYSSVAHAGYLLVALWPGTQLGTSAVMLYLFAYSLTTLAAFALLASLGRDGERTVRFDDLAGLATRRPWSALALAICMLSLLGFPGTFGFIGKWYILQAVIAESHYLLPVVLVVTSVVSAGYYLPVIMAMYMKPSPEHPADTGLELPRGAAVVVGMSLAAVVLFGILPGSMVDAALRGAGTLAQQVMAAGGR
jgi:NADH-quinone oxidoreductase subunit N